MTTRTWRAVACAAGLLLGASSVSPALAETPPSAEVQAVPAALEADLSAAEEQALTDTTSGSGVPLAAFVTTPDGPEIVTLDAGSRADAVAAVAVLDAQPSVEAADVVTPIHPAGATFAHEQYGNTMIRSEAARAGVDNPLPDVVVAVLDTGVWPHPELAATLTQGRNFTDSAGGGLDTTDRHGHGTHVAGTIAADTGSDVEGVAHGVRIMPVKVLGDTGAGWDSWAADGIIWAADAGADVINMSLGGAGYSSLEASAIDYARSKGVTVIAAAGNANSSAMYSPAGLPGVVAVSAVDATRAKAPFSNFGSSVDIAAPGVGILSTYNDGWLVYMSGTSMASPHVAGVAALVKGAAPGLTPEQVEQALTTSATDLGTPGRDDVFGHGLVDALRAVQTANGLEGRGTLLPGAPTMAAPSLGNGAVRVTWAPPADNGGSPITGYTVKVYTGATLLRTTPTPATARDLLVTGLTNGVAHTVTVGARNAPGAGPVATVRATPRTVPGAPRIGTSTPGSGAVVVRWAAPASNGGAPITGYSVRVYRGTTVVTTVPVPGATATATTVTGLANGTGYTFAVVAQNAAGAGPGSTRTAVVVPRTVPSVPAITSVAAGTSSATVRWAARSNGGAPVTSYVVRLYRGTTLVAKVNVSATTTSLTLSRLTPGAGHSFTVGAVNVAGTGPVSPRSGTVVPLR